MRGASILVRRRPGADKVYSATSLRCFFSPGLTFLICSTRSAVASESALNLE